MAYQFDLFSRKIVGWSTRPTIGRQLVLDAVMMAVKRRRPRGTIFYLDQGSRYGSDDWPHFVERIALNPHEPQRKLLGQRCGGVLFGSLKKECIKKRIYKDRESRRPMSLTTLNRFTIERAATVTCAAA
jgi:putative transposase